MPSNTFNRPHSQPSPPSYCYSHHSCLPPFLPPTGAPVLNGYARWTDLDPLAPIDVAIYTTMHHILGSWAWEGVITKGSVRFAINLQRLISPQPWAVTLTVWDHWRDPEQTFWLPITMQLEPDWDTGLQTHVYLPGLDFRIARVTQ